MMDVSDRATQREEEFRDDALREARRLPALMDSARECRACAEPIPDARRQALPGVQTCVECQTEHEHALSIFHPRSLA